MHVEGFSDVESLRSTKFYCRSVALSEVVNDFISPSRLDYSIHNPPTYYRSVENSGWKSKPILESLNLILRFDVPSLPVEVNPLYRVSSLRGTEKLHTEWSILFLANRS